MAKGQHVLNTDLSLANHAAIANLTSAVGTAGAGTVDVTATPTQTTINNNFATLVATLNVVLAALRDADIIAG